MNDMVGVFQERERGRAMERQALTEYLSWCVVEDPDVEVGELLTRVQRGDHWAFRVRKALG